MKKLLKIAAVVFAILLLAVSIGVWYVLHNLDSIAKEQVERGGTQALGVSTTVDRINIHIWDGNVVLHGLNIANPAGFKSAHFLNLKEGEVDVTLSSLREPVMDVPKFTLEGIDLNIEETDKGTNYQPILDSAKKMKGSAPAAPSAEPEKRLVIKDFTIKNVKIHLNVKGMQGPLGKFVSPDTALELPIDRIDLHNVGKTGSGVGGTGVTTSELASIIVQAVMAAAVEKGQGMIPDILLKDIQGRIGAIGDLAQMPVEVIGKVGEKATEIGQKAMDQVGKAAGDVGKGLGNAAGDAAKQIGDKIGDLIPGGKKDPKKP